MSLTRRPLSNIEGKQQMIFRNATIFFLLLKVYVVYFYYLTILILYFFFKLDRIAENTFSQEDILTIS